MKLYKVKSEDNGNENTIGGFLAAFGRIMFYTIGQAKRKARLFGGTLVPVDVPFTTDTVSMLQIPFNEIPAWLLPLMATKRAYTDVEPNGESIYYGDVFGEILSMPKAMELSADKLETLQILDSLSTYHQYIHLIK